MDKPKKQIKGLTFYPVPEFSGVDAAFGADEIKFFDRYDLPEVPGEYERMAQTMFFAGGSLPELDERIDEQQAARALKAWLGSFAPAHEAKIATAGYALWLWTDSEALSA